LKIYYKNDLDDVERFVEIVLDKQNKRVRVPGAKYIALRVEDQNVTTIWELTRLLINATLGGGRIK
jgi:hypothetical protein